MFSEHSSALELWNTIHILFMMANEYCSIYWVGADLEGTKLMTDVYSCNIMYILLAKIHPQKLKFIHEIEKIYINHAYEKGSGTLKHCEDHRLWNKLTSG